jgi:DNA polymerase III gamma/tau subunit
MPMVDQWTNDNEPTQWSEKYRPNRVQDCVIPDYRKIELQEMLEQNDIPSLLLSGHSGTGKTTIAKAICDEMKCDSIMLNGSDIGLDFYKFKHAVQSFASTVGLYGGKKIIIVDESDNMSSSSMKFLRGAMEEYNMNCRFIFTCNYPNKIIPSIHSRCATYDFNIPKDQIDIIKSQFIDLACTILDKENITHANGVVEQMMEKHFPDFRRILNELQKHSSAGEINELIFIKNSDKSIDLLFETLEQNSFDGVRHWTHLHHNDIEPLDFYRMLYDSLDDRFNKSQRTQATVKLNDYCYKSSAVQDQELNMVACLTELMEIINSKD